MRNFWVITLLSLLGYHPQLLRAQSPQLNKYVDIQYQGNQFVAVLDLFTQQTGYSFAYNNQLLPIPKYQNIHYQNVKADKALRDYLQQNGLDYQLSSKPPPVNG
ncbi:MAG: hypothetical protein RIS50_1427 [Bacteroidota bacterium]